MGQKYYRLELDYDNLNREEVDADAKHLAKKFPELGEIYHIESSKTEKDHYHVIFLKSKFTKFEEAYNIAVESKADEDWLTLCKEYECFALETEGSRRLNEIRQQREQHRIVNKPTKMILSPYIIDIIPTTSLDGRRIVKICEAIDDPEWDYNAFIHVWDLTMHIQIGCRDEAQANRRMAWLSQQGLQFTAKVKRNENVE